MLCKLKLFNVSKNNLQGFRTYTTLTSNSTKLIKMIKKSFLINLHEFSQFDSVFITKNIDSGGYSYSFSDYLKDSLKKQTEDNELSSQDYFCKFLYND